jgi:hypothetical protein
LRVAGGGAHIICGDLLHLDVIYARRTFVSARLVAGLVEVRRLVQFVFVLEPAVLADDVSLRGVESCAAQ